MLPVDRNSVMVGIQPRITLETFTTILESASSPALIDSKLAYKAILAAKVDPALLLAIFWQESAMGTVGLAKNNRSPGNTRSVMSGNLGQPVTTTKGVFIKYPSWFAGFKDMADRLTRVDYVYAQKGRRTIEQIIRRWAPPEDGNDTEGYIQSVIESMNKWVGSNEVINKMTLKIALSAGHHNTDGGSPVEAAITGPLCREYARAFRALGHDVRVITPDDGMGYSKVGLQAVAQQVVDWATAGWVADLYLETHTQGLGNTSVRGCFAIYPDWGSDIDLTVRNGLGSRICQAISQATGIPVYQAGVMSEKSTGVGIDGSRLGIFYRTAEIARKTTRLIVEHGAHTNPTDLAILQNPSMQTKIAQAAVNAIVTYFGDTAMSTNTSTPETVLINGHVLGHGMLIYWKSFEKPGIQHPLGLPISEEQDWIDPTGKKLVIQVFERAVLSYDATITDPAYRIQGLIIGPEWVKTHLSAA